MRACSHAYRKQEWDEALDLIERCRKLANGFDVAGLYDMYAERIEAYRAEPPGRGLEWRLRGGIEVDDRLSAARQRVARTQNSAR